MKKSLVFLAFFSLEMVAKPLVSVSILPQKYFVEQIADDTVQVNVLVGKGMSPATYEPKAKQMKELEKSDIYFAIGVPYERVWLEKFRSMFSHLKIVKTQDGVKKIPMKTSHHKHKQILDPHIWLDPVLVKQQAKNIAAALVRAYPKNKLKYENNLASFLAKIDKLDEEIRKLLEPKKGKGFLVFHPSWGYFASRYGLKQQAIEVEGKEPKARSLQKIMQEAKKQKLGVVFVSPQFSQKSAKVIAKQIDGLVVFIDPLALEWDEGLLKSAKTLATHLR